MLFEYPASGPASEADILDSPQDKDTTTYFQTLPPNLHTKFKIQTVFHKCHAGVRFENNFVDLSLIARLLIVYVHQLQIQVLLFLTK